MSVPQVKNNNILLLHSTQIAIFYVPIVHYRFFFLAPSEGGIGMLTQVRQTLSSNP